MTIKRRLRRFGLHTAYWAMYLAWMTLSFLTGIIPPVLGYTIAHFLGALAYYALPNRRRVAATNYAVVLREPANSPQVQNCVRASFRNFASYVYEVMRFPHMTMDEIDARVTLHVTDELEKARAMGKGVIFVSAHFGNMDLVGVSLSRHLGPLTVVGARVGSKRLMDKLVDFRAKKNVRLAITSSAPREVLQALRRNEYVGLLLDVGTQHDGDTVPVTFFGIPTRFPVGPAILALRTGAPIVVGYALVREDHHIDAFAYPPILVTPSGNKERDIRDCLQRIVAYFEDFIARNPDQWYMYRPMWATNAPVSVQDLPTADPLAEHAN